LINPVEVFVAANKKSVVVVGSRDFVEFLGLVCGVKELSAQTKGNNGIMLTVHDERWNIENPDLLNRIELATHEELDRKKGIENAGDILR
jgi:hypothetical protein